MTIQFEFDEPIKASKKRKHRATSQAAHESVKEHKQVLYDKIAEGLELLRVGGNFSEIAKVTGLEEDQVWRRLPEMVENGTCFNVGITRPSSRGRQSMVRQLTRLKTA